MKNRLKFVISAVRQFVHRQPLYSCMVIAVFSAATIYYTLICSDRYVSHAALRIEQDSDAGQIPALELGIMSLGGTSSSMQDVLLLQKYIQSPAMLGYLDSTLKLREHYTRRDIDIISRMSRNASRESFLAYYQDHVLAEVDESAQVLDLDIQGFDPEYAQKLSYAIAQRAEKFVNDISQALAREQIDFAVGELASANKRLNEAASAMADLQARHKIFNPAAESRVVGEIIAALEQQLAQSRIQLNALESYLSRRAPEVVALRKNIAALEAQIAEERSRQVGGDGVALNDISMEFREIQVELSLATELYKSSLATLESARLDATKKVKHLVMVSAPTLPDSAEEPRRLYILVTLFFVLHILFLTTRLVVATIKDHKD